MDKDKVERKKNAAEARWEAAQLQAAAAQRELDYAVAIFEKDKTELDQETIDVIYAQIQSQKSVIEEFILKSKQVFLDETRQYEFRMNRAANA
jgi:hypothetical protein